MPDVDDLGVIRELLLTADPPTQDVNDYVRARLNAVIAAAGSHPGAARSARRTPVSRHMRARRIPLVAGALAAAAAAAVAVTALLPSGHPGDRPGTHSGSIRLAAWTVARQANGDIDVTISQLKNPAGLQSTLREEGLAASVTFSRSGLSSSCQPYVTSLDVLNAVFRWHTSGGSAYLVINPSALPRDTGVGIFDEPGAGGPVPAPSPGALQHGKGSGSVVEIPMPAGIDGPLAVGLVYASPQCTR